MIKPICKHGNSLAVILDKPLLEIIGAREKSKLHVRISGRSIILTPSEGAISKDQFQTSAKKISGKYSNLLSRLAK